MDNDEKQRLIEHYLQAYNGFDVDGMLAVLAPDVVFENHSGGQLTVATRGAAEFRQLAEQASALFSEREQRLTALALEAEPAVAEIAYRGRLAADIPGGPAAGSLIELQGRSEFSFADGRISAIVDRS